MIEWKLAGDWPKVTYVIATNPRTGSWLLADSLCSTKRAGKPGEWFSELEEAKIRRHFPDMTYEAYVKFTCAESCTNNGVSAIKMHRRDFRLLEAKAPVATVLRGAKWVWLSREDKARQAISYVIARWTHEWWRIEGSPKPHWVKVPYDRDAIATAEAELTRLDQEWEDWFAAEGIDPLRLTYEHDLDNGAFYDTAVDVMEWLGVKPRPPGPTRLVRQADQRNEEWLARYLE